MKVKETCYVVSFSVHLIIRCSPKGLKFGQQVLSIWLTWCIWKEAGKEEKREGRKVGRNEQTKEGREEGRKEELMHI